MIKMSIFTSIILSVPLIAGATPIDSFNCQQTDHCIAAAKSCGAMVGIEIGAKVCRGESAKPDPEYVWSNEVKGQHCMGFLPIIATINDQTLSIPFITAFEEYYSASIRAAGCIRK